MQLLVGYIGCTLMMSLMLIVFSNQIWELPFRNKKVNLTEILFFFNVYQSDFYSRDKRKDIEI